MGAPLEEEIRQEPSGPVSFDQFVEREYGGVLALVIAVHGAADPEDIVQEAFLRAERHWPRLADAEFRRLWVRRVALNLAVSRFRRVRAESKALLRLASRPDPARRALAVPSTEVWDQVRRLPRRQAQVIALRYLEDRPIADIARLLDVAEGTVRALLHQGRSNLARALGETIDDDTEAQG